MAEHPALREQQWRSWHPKSEDPEALAEAFLKFCRDVWVIRTVRGARLYEPTPEQEQAAFDAIKHQKTIDLKARQIGFSTLYAALVFWENFFWPDRESAFFSIGEREAHRLMRMVRFGYRKLPAWVRDRGPQLVDHNLQKMSWANESQVESLPTGDDPGRGATFYRVIFDEFAMLPNQDDAYASIDPTVDAGGRLNLLSTAKGAGSFFEQLFVDARHGENDFIGHFFPWSAAKWRDDAWYEAKQRDWRHTPHKLHQEYPRDEFEAFIRAGNAVFDLDRLRVMEVSEPIQVGVLLDGQFQVNPDGDIAQWELPTGQDHYVIGADVAKGLGHGDWSTAHVIKAKTGEVVARVRAHMEPDLWGAYLADLAALYGDALLGIENNTFGLSANNAARRRGHANLFRMRSLKQRNPDQLDEYGWATTAVTKPYVISGLQEWLRDHNMPDAVTLHELKTYVRNERGQMEGSPHDDLVMSLALAVEMLRYVYEREYMPKSKAPIGSFDWYKSEMRRQVKARKPKRDRLGSHSRA